MKDYTEIKQEAKMLDTTSTWEIVLLIVGKTFLQTQGIEAKEMHELKGFQYRLKGFQYRKIKWLKKIHDMF